eukprot:CAMPEP_0115327532 /NCGR_PEP_ID=MMETSP0270-20121206/84187_1 /TAXON_ID=71861 /ORGANISM="Scrippsiella trochoidea, Strain CCMP3099" /LENGTH=86 /DNA_ID=CAMNT_0002747973 /DNA_START=117 /DNA_END=377 /DNA_ORIENTATION=-
MAPLTSAGKSIEGALSPNAMEAAPRLIGGASCPSVKKPAPRRTKAPKRRGGGARQDLISTPNLAKRQYAKMVEPNVAADRRLYKLW